MKPTLQFIQMISTLFQNHPKTITHNDIAKHNASAVTFYSMSHGTFVRERLASKTELFSDQIMIEIERGANKTIVGSPTSNTIYTRTSPIEFGQLNGNGFVHWKAVDERNNNFYIVKLLADDLTMQIKIMTPDQQYMTVHNVCELPQR